ncbi:hypothetical protein K435DRAFT_576666, partial [Dendrothele bispora CBS 962.96]
MGDVIGLAATYVLNHFAPYPGDELRWGSETSHRFVVFKKDDDHYAIDDDAYREFTVRIPRRLLLNRYFNLPDWYNKHIKRLSSELANRLRGNVEYEFLSRLFKDPENEFEKDSDRLVEYTDAYLHLLGGNTYPGLQRNASIVRDIGRLVPRPIVVVVKINDRPCRALIDSGSLGDFISTQVADQLKLKKRYLETPLPLHLAVQGSRSKVLYGANANFKYQNVDCEHYFDVANLSGYDVILGTPFMFMHSVRIGLNPATVEISSDVPLPIKGENVSEIRSNAIHAEEHTLESARDELREYANPICKGAAETPLPPLRVINHSIPLIEEDRIYPWRPSRCPEAFREQWDLKRRDYL